MKGTICRIYAALCMLCAMKASAFHPQSSLRATHPSPHFARQNIVETSPRASQWSRNAVERSETDLTCWNPQLRRTMGAFAMAGVLETGYLTFNKLVGAADICGTSGDCSSVLNGPYAYLPGTGIPLSLLGFGAYCAAAFLSLDPLFVTDREQDDTLNRKLLAAITAAMGTFEVFLMYILSQVLHESCTFCLASAAFTFALVKFSWIGGLLPKEDDSKEGAKWSGAGVVGAVCLAGLLLQGGAEPSLAKTNFAGTPTTVLADSNEQKLFSPPPIETKSSSRALSLAKDLEKLDAKMYGAYWCSHCFEQKSALGKEAFAKVTYLECAKDGMNSQSKECKARDVPGYPTWEIGGELFPGEQALDELEEIVQKLRSKS